MNIYFSKIIKVNDKQREFNFRKPNGREQALCTVDVSDDRGQRIIFSMQKDDTNHTWKIVPQALPVWITQLEKKLSDLIEEELQNY